MEDAAAGFEEKYVKVTAVSADLASSEGVDELWPAIEGLGHPIDVACLNAGVGVGGVFRETDLDGELNMVNLNCNSTPYFC